ncbi:cycloartenol synthase, partial [Tanacetum coccineum]
MVCCARLGLLSFIAAQSLHLAHGLSFFCESTIPPSNPSPSLWLLFISPLMGCFGLSVLSGERDIGAMGRWEWVMTVITAEYGWGLDIEGHSTMFGSTLNYVTLRLLGEGANDGEWAMEKGR